MILFSTTIVNASEKKTDSENFLTSAWKVGGSWIVTGQHLDDGNASRKSKPGQMNTRLDIELTREIPSHQARFFGHIRVGNGAGVQVSTPTFSAAVNSTVFAGSSSGQHETKAILAQAWLEVAPSPELDGLSVIAGKIDPAVFLIKMMSPTMNPNSS